MGLRTVFFGTPDFAVPTLEAMAAAGYGPRLVVAQPARRAGRGRRLQQPPVARWALAHGFDLAQPESVRDEAFLARLAALRPAVSVVVAFGQIFRRPLLELPRQGSINVHASLLPAYRGAAPIQAAIAAGDQMTGITTMWMEAGLDTGPALLRAELEIGADETAGELNERLARLGGELLVRTLVELEAGTLEAQPQDDSLASYAPRLQKSDGRVDWRRPAIEIYRQLRALTPWPGLTGLLGERPLKLLWGRPESLPEPAQEPPGTCLALVEGRLLVSAGEGTIFALEKVQRPGRQAVAAADFWRGERLAAGQRFDLEPAAESVG